LWQFLFSSSHGHGSKTKSLTKSSQKVRRTSGCSRSHSQPVTPPESVPYFGTQLTTVINKNAHIVVPRIAAENKHISDGIFRFNAGPFLGHNAIIVNNLPEALKILRDRPKTWDRTPRVEAGFKLINLENLFSENRESWGRLRRLLAPAFNNKTVRECNSDIFLVTKRLLEVMRKTAEANDGAAVFDRDIFERFAFDSVALVSFGFDANSISDNRTDEEVKKSMEKREETNRVHERLGVPASVAVDEFFSFVGRTIVLQYPKWLWTARDRQASQYCERFCSIAHDLIDEARKEPPKLEKSEKLLFFFVFKKLFILVVHPNTVHCSALSSKPAIPRMTAQP
jgi:cytochrome P450